MHFHLNNRFTVLAITALGLILSLTAGAANTTSTVELTASKLPTLEIQVGQKYVTAEIANTDWARKTGLMHREKMEKNNGMLFIFERSDTQCMWMKNTLIHLDVAFADDSGKILNIEQMKAGTQDIHCSKGKSKMALEMNSRWFMTHGITQGSVIQIPESHLFSQ